MQSVYLPASAGPEEDERIFLKGSTFQGDKTIIIDGIRHRADEIWLVLMQRHVKV